MKIVKLLRMGALLAASIAFVGCEMTLSDEDSRKEVVEAKAKANAASGSGSGGGSTGDSSLPVIYVGLGGENTFNLTSVKLDDKEQTIKNSTLKPSTWNAISEFETVQVKKGSSVSFTFTQTAAGASAWNTWALAIYDNATASEAKGNFVRGDNWLNKSVDAGFKAGLWSEGDATAGGAYSNEYTYETAGKALTSSDTVVIKVEYTDSGVKITETINEKLAYTAEGAFTSSTPAPTTDNSGNNGNNDSGNNGNNNSGNTENGQNGGTEKTVASIAITNASLKYDFYNPAAYTEIINSTSLTKAIDFTVTATYSDNTTGSLAASSCTFAVTGTNVTATYNSLTSPAYALPAPTYIISEATTVTDSNAMKSSSDAVLAKGKTSAALFTAKNADDNTYNVWVEIWGNSGVTMRMDNWAWNYGWDGAEAGSGLTIGATDGGDADKKSIVASESDWLAALKTKLTSGYKVLAVIENGNSDVNVTLTSPEWAGWKQTYKLSKASDTANGEVRFHFNTGAANSSIAFQ